MKTKAQIIQRLLEEKKIDAEEAVILMMRDDTPHYVYIPQPYPVYPTAPQYWPPIVTFSWSDLQSRPASAANHLN